jgi:succinate dehydrogenase / fumarate reductase iron-sulfur subunit
MALMNFQIWRGDANGGNLQNYAVETSEGMVVLDAVHKIQAEQANDLAVRWNCKAGKCGSCSAEINGIPKLMCMTRLKDLPADKAVLLQTHEGVSGDQGDLVTDVSWNFEVKNNNQNSNHGKPDAADGTWRIAQKISIACRN